MTSRHLSLSLLPAAGKLSVGRWDLENLNTALSHQLIPISIIAGLFFRGLPNKGYVIGSTKPTGGKAAKERLTGMIIKGIFFALKNSIDEHLQFQ